jgi:hypothetical protein
VSLLKRREDLLQMLLLHQQKPRERIPRAALWEALEVRGKAEATISKDYPPLRLGNQISRANGLPVALASLEPNVATCMHPAKIRSSQSRKTH